MNRSGHPLQGLLLKALILLLSLLDVLLQSATSYLRVPSTFSAVRNRAAAGIVITALILAVLQFFPLVIHIDLLQTS